MDRFDTFGDDARSTLTLAQSEADRLGHHYIGTEHLLLGLTLVDHGVAPDAFPNARPAATMVIVAGLLDPRWKVEIEAEAQLWPTEA